MADLLIVAFLVLVVAIVMTMVGKGGGNFYVVILAIADIPMHEAATTGQFILFTASLAAMIIFQKNGSLGFCKVPPKCGGLVQSGKHRRR